MATQAPIRALTVALSSAQSVEYNLDNWPSESFNRLIPTQTIAMPSDLFTPVIQIVQLEPADRDGKSPDHYKSSDVPAGHRALTARGIRKLVTAASVSFGDERRIDDGSDPDIIGVSVMASMLLPTGQRITAPGTQLINIRTWFGSQTSPAELAKFRKQFYAHVSTRALNRSARGLLSLRASYPDREIAKPFAVVSFAPNMNHPEIRQAVIAAMVPAITASFGPEARQITAGQVIQVTEAPEDDVAPAPQQVDVGGPQPDWADVLGNGSAAAPAESQLVTVLREKAAASDLSGEASPSQKEALAERILRPLGGVELFGAGLRATFGIEPATNGKLYLTAAQAEALLTISRDADWQELWTEAFGS